MFLKDKPSFTPTLESGSFIAMLTLFALEGLVESAFRLAGAQPPPIHRIFTLLFVPTAFILAGTGGWALGVALRDRPLARRAGLSAGLAAGVAFLVIFAAAGRITSDDFSSVACKINRFVDRCF